MTCRSCTLIDNLVVSYRRSLAGCVCGRMRVTADDNIRLWCWLLTE